MAARKPLVIASGQIQQLQSGDTLDAPQTGPQVEVMTNGEAGAIVIGTSVRVSAADTVLKAQANATGTKDAIGLVRTTSISAAAAGEIALDGVLVATTGQWDAVTGASGGLTSGSKYYLDPATSGRMTTIAPTTVGQYVCPLGKALSTTEFMIDIEETVLL